MPVAEVAGPAGCRAAPAPSIGADEPRTPPMNEPAATAAWPLLGVDFTCAPSRRKPITVAQGRLRDGALEVAAVERIGTLEGFERCLARPGPWFGGFDFPFGLPRVFVDELALGRDVAGVVAELRRRCPTRAAMRSLVDAWGNRRPPGSRLPHRVCDRARPGASSTSPLQTRYVPVGFMYFEGFARLVRAGVHVPGLRAGDAARVAVEAYPARAAHAVVGARSYKNSDAADRTEARVDIVRALARGEGGFGLRLALPRALRAALIEDASGDALDATLCLVQAAWAAGQPAHGLPPDADPVEGWIVGPVAA